MKHSDTHHNISDEESTSAVVPNIPIIPADDKPKPNRKRPVHLHLWATEEEAALIRQRMSDASMVSLSAYIRRMAISGYHVNVDLTNVRELVTLLKRCSNNLNQYARRAHETRSVYEADIEDLRQQFNTFWDAANGILQGLARIK